MSKSPLIKSARQRGDVLLGALIGMLLLAITGLGIVYAVSRVSVSQKDMNVHNLVVNHLRAELQEGSVIHSDLVIGGDTFKIKKYSKEVTLDISGKEIKITMDALSATKEKDSHYKICVGPIPCNE